MSKKKSIFHEVDKYFELSTTDVIDGRVVVENLGLVTGSIVKSRNMFSNIGAGFKSIIGGEIRSLTKLMQDSRKESLERLVADAKKQGANGVTGIRFTSSSNDVFFEIMCYGTAVHVQ